MSTQFSFVGKKVLNTFGILIGTTLLVFFLIKMAPGNPYAGWSPELMNEFGVNKNIFVQYINWLINLFIFNLGVSVKSGQSVLGLVGSKYFITVIIVTGALIFSLLLSIPLGFLSVFKRDSRTVKSLVKIFELISSTPVFILAYIIFFIFITQFKINITMRDDFNVFQICFFYICTFIVLGIGNGTVIELIEHLDNELRQIKNKMYMTAVTARSANYVKHLAKSIAIPILTVIANRFVFLLSSAVIVEYIFTIRGIGLLSIQAAKDRDYPLILGITVATIVIVVIIKTIVEIIIQKINPNTA